MPIGILQIYLYLPQVQSLKGKRHIIKPIIHDLQTKFHVSVAEVGKQDIWKSSELLVATASSDSIWIEQRQQEIINHIESRWPEIYITRSEMEIIFE
jgi:uncharacterized protein YlxP (DUF503 family)